MGHGWRLLLRDAGLEHVSVLRAAALPEDLLDGEDVRLAPADYFRFWNAVAQLAPDPAMPVRVVSKVSAEAFESSMFAAMCSPDFETAMRRLARFKPLFGPVRLDVGARAGGFGVSLRFVDPGLSPPPSLALAELAIWLRLARMGTRHPIVAVAARSPVAIAPSAEIDAFFGVPVEAGEAIELVVSAEDARRPYLTRNEALWEFFEPELRRRLRDLTRDAAVQDRLRSVLLEMLPGGETSIEAAARRLATSKRTLQRRLAAEATSYQIVLDEVREQLARHYLTQSRITNTEIALLLGFADPNSFFRAFHAWTGHTPEAVRSASGGAGVRH
jgi:AraC-like DNA-binding protein